MLAALAAIALGVGVVATPQFVAEEAQYVQAQKAYAVVQVVDSRTAGVRRGEDLGR